jgi:uncharacterized protein with PIN domain
VLDASAILAVINAEPGAEKLTPDLLAGAVGSAVNLAEVQTKLVSRGWTSDQAWEDATSQGVEEGQGRRENPKGKVGFPILSQAPGALL